MQGASRTPSDVASRMKSTVYISRVDVKNFRLLQNVSISFERKTTLVVGRNNAGKTSLMELFRRLLSEKTPQFRLEDFSLAAHKDFWKAAELRRANEQNEQILETLPVIEVKLTFGYDINASSLGALSNCIIDLNPECNEALVVISFNPEASKVALLFDDIRESREHQNISKKSFFQAIKERLANCYALSIQAVDPYDHTNRKAIEWSMLTAILQSDFINAQRGLDDTTSKERDVLGKILESLFNSAASNAADAKDQELCKQLTEAIESIQAELDKDFNLKLTSLLPTFNVFGYPGLSDPKLVTETQLDVERLLTNHTKVRYTGLNGVNLPESYNGLGTRNLIFILLQIFGFFRNFKLRASAAGVHLICIEEPEAHLHPQMQEVFIRQLERIVTDFEEQMNDGLTWPVQFLISTHSSHIANEAHFESIRYFLAVSDTIEDSEVRTTRVKDLRQGFDGIPDSGRHFIHQYLTLTRCDLFFADKAILIEGPIERMLLPKIIQKIDNEPDTTLKLASQYLAVMEVGGAYSHIFFELLDFLELPALIITDIDSVKKNETKYKACKVSEGEKTSNSCLKAWFNDPDISPRALIACPSEKKTRKYRRLAYQIPENGKTACGRSFEDAFVLANLSNFPTESTGIEAGDSETHAWNYVHRLNKTEFALKHAIEETTWAVPLYIAEGMRWLARTPSQRFEFDTLASPKQSNMRTLSDSQAEVG